MLFPFLVSGCCSDTGSNHNRREEEYVRKVMLVLLCLALAVGAFGQDVDLSRVELADLDLTRADWSNASFYFAGPVDLLVRGIVYMGVEYAAVLQYDGMGTVRIAAPQNPSTEGLPFALDLSKVQLSVVEDGIVVSNVIADGYYFSGKLVPTPTLDLAVSPQITMGGVATVPDLRQEVAMLEGQLSAMRRAVTNLESAQRTTQSELSGARGELSSAQTELSAAQAQITSLERQLSAARAAAPAAVVVDPLAVVAEVTRTVKTGFTGGSSVLGTWSLSGNQIRQTDADQFFAKHRIPVTQNANELVYMFRGSGQTRGWSGYGLHLLASGSADSRLYGHGTSYLVWVTRDPLNTQSDQTFVQLYRSYSDTHMVQVANYAVNQAMDRPMDLTVYVNRGEGRIIVGANGEFALTYVDPSMIRSGSEVVVRSLGPATLSALAVRSR